MATSLKFDELNKFSYREYFGEMFTTPEQMRRRVSLAEDIEDVIFFLFAYYSIYDGAELEIDSASVRADAKERLTSVVEKHMKVDPYVANHINTVIDEVADVTEEHIRKRKQDEDNKAKETEDADSDLDEFEKLLNEESNTSPDSENGFYWTSYTRAMYISANEANAFENYNDFLEAKANGKTKKRWITELDDKVRFTHTLVEGETVDIDGLFLVGGSFMRFPKDAEYDPAPQEVVNCRCTVDYL